MKIYDCFPFYNEFELLELRFKLYYEFVDYFVIVESNVDYRGNEKRMYLKENLDRFDRYKDKIIYLSNIRDSIDTTPTDYTIDNQQRDYLITGLNRCEPNDIIFLSDVDEFYPVDILKEIKFGYLKKNIIKKRRIIRKRRNKYRACLKYIKLYIDTFSKDVFKVLDYTPIVFGQKHFYYFMNNLHKDMWCGSIVCQFKNIESIQRLRDLRRRLPIIKGGAHFAYMGGLERILKKINSTVDENPNRQKNKIYSIEEVKRNIQRGSLMYDFQNKEDKVFSRISVDDIGVDGLNEFKKKYPNFFI